MFKYWPSYNPSPRRPNYNKFWSEEWGKHGTCVSTLGPNCMGKDMAVYSYFDKSLKLREEYDIYAALAAHNITPGDTYPVDKVISAIEQELHIGAANKDQYKPAKRPDGTEKAKHCSNRAMHYPKKRTESDANWSTQL
ncbi:Ribonuclease T2 precursor (RNase T2) [Podila epicladia]|nr:Ribonuclease T2 precursor (RNase T2) [Podila epicladia]